MICLLFPLITIGDSIAIKRPLYQEASAPVQRRVADLLTRMTIPEKARQLDLYAGTKFVSRKLDNTHMASDAKLDELILKKSLGDLGVGAIHDLYPTPKASNQIQNWVMSHERLHIPALFLEEGVHGYLGFHKTVYPCSINLASTFDVELAKKTASQIASEARADGVDMLLGPVLDVAREPRWGRIEEDFGEDSYLTGKLGEWYVRGMQGDSLASDSAVISEPKHFAGHGSPEGGTNTSPVHAGEREIRSVFLRSFEPAIRVSGARGVMAAYHEIDGIPCAANPWLLRQVLRKEWGFKGFVLSDLGAVSMLYDTHHVAATPAEAIIMAIRSGVNMQFYDFPHETYQKAIIDGIAKGTLTKQELDGAVGEVLRVKFELGLFDHPFVDTSLNPRVTRSKEHLKTSYKSACESICLLKNANHLLPLSESVGQIAVIGPNATSGRTGDYTSQTPGFLPVSISSGIESLLGDKNKVLADDGSDLERAVEVAKKAEVVVLGLGERDGISGEGSDRTTLDLPEHQEQLLEAIAATGKPCVLVLENGRPLSVTWAAAHIPAIVEAWYPGEFGGNAIAETLFGKNNPSGHLPISFPTTVGAIPDYYNHHQSKNDRYVDGTAKPLYPFGFGLSYTQFAYSRLEAKVGKGLVTVSATVQNHGSVAGDAVVQLYLGMGTSSVATPERSLRGFQRVHLSPGESKVISFQLGRYELEIWGVERKWSVEAGTYHVWLGGSSVADLTTTFKVRPGQLSYEGPLF